MVAIRPTTTRADRAGIRLESRSLRSRPPLISRFVLLLVLPNSIHHSSFASCTAFPFAQFGVVFYLGCTKRLNSRRHSVTWPVPPVLERTNRQDPCRPLSMCFLINPKAAAVHLNFGGPWFPVPRPNDRQDHGWDLGTPTLRQFVQGRLWVNLMECLTNFEFKRRGIRS